jgi:glutamate/tyrosine decarboxylase-like PLP-dependent enzyme
MPLHTSAPAERADDELSIRPEFAQPGELAGVPRFRLAKQMLPPETAYQLIHDELLLDPSNRLNLATFISSWMEPQARVLIDECLDKNIVDRDTSPQTTEIEKRCITILADLWHAPEAGRAIGCSTTGSSEAGMLGGLALKWRWREGRRRAGEPADRPNLVMGADVLPEDLIFKVNYLGGTMPTFALNFSRSSSPVVAQYFEMVRLGRDGFTRVQQACRDTAAGRCRPIPCPRTCRTPPCCG